MTSMNHIIYLSSDEEDAKVVDCTAWLDGVLETSDEKPKGAGHRKSNLSNPDEDGDDDCVVLDGDPYKTTEKESTFDTCETDDEILVVGQKGEIACRDFPHPRHACAKYPFNSISHEKYCDMCHCYVCDIRAPCPYWCFGISSIDHCHANDKEQIWKNQRECIRTGEILTGPASTIAQLQQLPQSQSIRSSQNSLYSPATPFGIRACSASTMVATRPTNNTYIRPGFRTEQSATFSQNPGLQPLAGQLSQNHRGGSYNGYFSPQVLSSNPFTWTQRPSRGANLPGNGVHNVAPGSQYTGYAPPAGALQVNSQRIVTDYISTVPESQSKVYGRHFSRNMCSGNAQTNAVSSENPNPRENQQQQSGRSNAKALSEIEDWLMDNSTTADPMISGERERESSGESERDIESSRRRGNEVRRKGERVLSRKRGRESWREGERSDERERDLRRRRSGERETYLRRRRSGERERENRSSGRERDRPWKNLADREGKRVGREWGGVYRNYP